MFTLGFSFRDVDTNELVMGVVKADSIHDAALVLSKRFHNMHPRYLTIYKLEFINDVAEMWEGAWENE